MKKKYIAEQYDRVINFRNTLDLETDRGCALLAVSFLEVELKELLKKCLIQGPGVEKNIFSYNGPLGTFSSKIEMSYFLGKISPEIRNELHLLRKIRNDFGHSPEYLDFNNEAISDRCKALKGSWKGQQSSPRQHFTASVCAILAVVHKEIYSTNHPQIHNFEFPFKENKEKFEAQVNEIVALLINKNN
jgi:DNA-binding MltR family transcriptional regulator